MTSMNVTNSTTSVAPFYEQITLTSFGAGLGTGLLAWLGYIGYNKFKGNDQRQSGSNQQRWKPNMDGTSFFSKLVHPRVDCPYQGPYGQAKNEIFLLNQQMKQIVGQEVKARTIPLQQELAQAISQRTFLTQQADSMTRNMNLLTTQRNRARQTRDSYYQARLEMLKKRVINYEKKKQELLFKYNEFMGERANGYDNLRKQLGIAEKTRRFNNQVTQGTEEYWLHAEMNSIAQERENLENRGKKLGQKHWDAVKELKSFEEDDPKKFDHL